MFLYMVTYHNTANVQFYDEQSIIPLVDQHKLSGLIDWLFPSHVALSDGETVEAETSQTFDLFHCKDHDSFCILEAVCCKY